VSNELSNWYKMEEPPDNADPQELRRYLQDEFLRIEQALKLLHADGEWGVNSMVDFFHKVSSGQVPGHSNVHKFGKNAAVPTAYAPLALGGVYRTPQIAGATTLRIKAGGNVNDDAAGPGAREITLECMDVTGAIMETTLATAGASASSATVDALIRIVGAYVSESGTYADASTPSHAGDIVIENSAGTEDWLTIGFDDLGKGQSQIGIYTVPLGHTAYIYNYVLTTDNNKPVDFLFIKREGILDTSAPYQSMRSVVEEVGITGDFDGEFKGGQKFTELTDIGWMARGASTPIVTCDFEILLVDNNYL